MSALGSYAWGERRGGRLTTVDRLTVIKTAVASRLKRRLLGAPRSTGGSGRLDLDALRLPDSTLVARVTRVCEEAYPDWLLNHCYRTWLWGGLVGQREGMRFDREELLVASLCHDLGLTGAAGLDATCECFAIRGARYSRRLLDELGAPHLAPSVAQSIALHLNIVVGKDEPLDYLLHEGAQIDVVGWGGSRVAAARDQVLARHPHLGFAEKLITTVGAEANAHPGGRLALMIRFGFVDLIARHHGHK
jgi:hypothetical protein